MTIDRYEKLLKQSVDAGNPANVRQKFAAEAERMRQTDPEIARWVAFKQAQSAPPPATEPRSTRRVPELARIFIHEAQVALSTHAPTLVQAAAAAAVTAATTRLTPRGPSRMTNRTSNLLHNLDIAGRIFSDDDGDTFVLTITMSAADAEALAESHADGAKKLAPKIGTAVCDAVVELAESEGSIGEWPFDEED